MSFQCPSFKPHQSFDFPPAHIICIQFPSPVGWGTLPWDNLPTPQFVKEPPSPTRVPSSTHLMWWGNHKLHIWNLKISPQGSAKRLRPGCAYRYAAGKLRQNAEVIMGHPFITFAKFSRFWTPSPPLLVCFLGWIIGLNSCNLAYYIRFWVPSPPPPLCERNKWIAPNKNLCKLRSLRL